MKLLVFGNKYLKEDSMAIAVAEELEKNIDIEYCEDPWQLLNHEGELFLLDVASNINNVRRIEDVSELDVGKSVSLHDLDLSYFLKLMKAIGKELKITVIAVPPQGNAKKLADKVMKLLPDQL